MKILSLKIGHDGAVALIEDGVLQYSLEAEKNSFPRYVHAGPALIIPALSKLDRVPDVIAVGGWHKGTFPSGSNDLETGYFGHGEASFFNKPSSFVGTSVHYFSSSHARSHIFGAYGLSPWPQGQPCYVLIWEGALGEFYEISPSLEIVHLGSVLGDPGEKYLFPYMVAECCEGVAGANLSYAGKLMALAAFSDRSLPSHDEKEFINGLFERVRGGVTKAQDFKDSPFFGIGVQSDKFKQFMGKFSDALFEKFFQFARSRLTQQYPLLIAGGCGLNCEWNSHWKESGLFEDVFVPPCANDSGSAIGTGVDAQFFHTGNAKISWTVYSGDEFNWDTLPSDYLLEDLDYERVASLLLGGAIIGWVQGRYEMGPRALGHRSILAAPFLAGMRDRLNAIKQREPYRPVAAICTEEDAVNHFDPPAVSPYMLYFQQVKSPQLAAVTHVDGTTRLQTINRDQDEPTFLLLEAFKRLSGVAVLCNTSLNFSGKGFINTLSDLTCYARERCLSAFVVGDKLFTPAAGVPELKP